jgi:phosphodiesterase/alkaline phosphatase D-like protein
MSRRLTLLALAWSTIVAPAARAGLPPCTQAIAGAVEKYAVGKRKAMAKCENKRSSGKLLASVNCRPALGPVTDLGTDKKLTALAAKVEPAISGKCTGPLPPLGPACDIATTVPDLAACITAPVQDADVEPINIDTLVATVYDTTPPITDTPLRKCQAAISKAGGKYLAARMKAKRKCAIAVGAGKITGPCPDADAAAAIEKARATMQAGILKLCSETQLAADSPPALTFAPHCRSYKLLTYKRGAMNENTIPVFDRFLRCITDAHAGVADRTVNIGLPQPEGSGFVEGVAAGDATDDSAIFWTRVPDASMGATLEITTDPTFTSVAQTIPVTPDADGFVKEDVGMLAAKTVHFYRFKQAAETSAVGRVVTTPDPSDATRVVHLGWSGDSNAFNRPYTSLDPLRLLAPDGWFYIGDTIYGDDDLADGLVAMTQPEYEMKYRANRSDVALRGLMESTGTYSQWDDHEVRNDFAGAEPVFATRMAAGNAAFRRYMPLREDIVDPMQLYRSARWGSGAEFFIIDDRQYRSAKYTCCSSPNEADSGFVTTDADSTCPGGGAGEATFPSPACNTAMSGATRTILGTAQKTWLENGLLGSTATFKFIMNGPPITQLLFLPYDRWEAWSAERTEILDFIVSNGIKNVVWLSTDLHAIVISPTRVDVAMTHAMPEIVAGAIGENTIFRELPPSVEASLPGLPGVITQVSEFELDRYNVVLITVDPTLATPRANFDFYDRTGSIIHTLFFDAVP